jgi:hypothetical protein
MRPPEAMKRNPGPIAASLSDYNGTDFASSGIISGYRSRSLADARPGMTVEGVSGGITGTRPVMTSATKDKDS